MITGTLTEDVSVTVYYHYAAETAPYTVLYLGHKVDGSGEIQLDTYTGSGPIGSTVIVPDKRFDGYLREPADMNLVITADGMATKNLYYVKKINPSIVFNTDGSHVESITAAPGEDISAQIQAIQPPTRDGYVFDGWDQELPTVMPEEDLVIHAVWKPGTSNYTVQYLFQNTRNDGYTHNAGMDEVRQATTDTIVTATDEDKQKGITLGTGAGAAFFGFDYKGCDDVQVTADGEAVLNLYFDREIWTVNLYDNPIGDEKTTKAMYDSFDRKLWKTFSGRYGAPYPSDFPTEVELNDHFTQITPADWEKYKFMGLIVGSETRWNGKNGLVSGVTFTTSRSFVLEDVEGRHTVDIYPLYTKIAYSLSTSRFIQSLNDPSQYDYYNGKVIPVTDSTGRYTIAPPNGFTILGGYYRTKAQGVDWPGENQDYGWQQVTEIEEDGTKEIQTKEVLEIRFQRVKNTVTFVSMDGTSYQTLKTIENVYYQTPLGEELHYTPVSTDGKRFAGWYLSEDDFDKQPLGDDYTMPWTDVTLYAKWADPHCKVEFDSRGGSDVPTQYVEKNEKAKRPEVPTKANYTFVGWFTAEGDRWAFDSEISEDITLYAVWKPTISGGYTIQHIMQGTGELIAEFTGTGMIGDTIVARALNAQDAEYKDGTYLVPDAPTKSLVLTEDGTNTVEFYYRLGGLKDYTVSYYLEGTQTKLAPDKEVKNAPLSQVTEEAISIPNYVPNATYQTVILLENSKNHIIFYYSDVPAISYTVTYDLNGGDANGKDYSPVTVDSGEKVTVKDAPVRDGYTFTEWSDGINAYQPGDVLTVTGNITLTAQWRKTGGGGNTGSDTTYYILHYESNGGTKYKDERYVKNTIVQLDKVPVREGYQFTGWYADKELTERITSIKMTSDKTVYAGWRKATVPDMLNGDDHFAYVIGYTDGTVRPNANISRSEVAAIFFRLLKPEVRDGNLTSFNTFTDVNEGMWCNKSISTMAALNIVKGRSAERFDPDAPITRAEFAAICARFDTGMTEGDSNFTDISGHWAEAEIERAASLGWIMGYTDGTFRPDNYITRAEAMTMINRVLCRIPEDEDDLLPGMNVWPDNQPGAWYYLAVQEATNSHDFRYRGEIYEHWIKLTTDPDWTRYQD